MPHKRKDYQEAVFMYQKGLSLSEIAACFSVSRQSIWMTLKRRGVNFRSNLRTGSDNHFYRGGKVRNLNFVLAKAVKRGILTVGPCEVCGLPPLILNGRQRIHGHHDNYNYPLSVRWLCKKHHDDWHKCNKAIPRSSDWKPTERAVICSMGGKASRKNTKLTTTTLINRSVNGLENSSNSDT